MEPISQRRQGNVVVVVEKKVQSQREGGEVEDEKVKKEEK